MIKRVRENIYWGDKNAFKTLSTLEKKRITSVVVVADDMVPADGSNSKIDVVKVGVSLTKLNKPHIKDLACHCPKYMAMQGETVLVQSVTGMRRAAYVIARMLCEMEQKTIYETLNELKEIAPELEIGLANF